MAGYFYHSLFPAMVVARGRNIAVIDDTVGSTITNSAALAVRGGGQGHDYGTLDLERATLRLEGLDTYTVICAIILSAIMDVYNGCETKIFSCPSERVAQYIHSFCSTTSVFCALYVIVLFSLFTLYAKTALGANKDDIYSKILGEDTSMYRYLGFQAFVVSLAAFECAYVVNIFLNFRGRQRWLFSSMAAVGTVLCLKEWIFLFHCASTSIFKT